MRIKGIQSGKLKNIRVEKKKKLFKCVENVSPEEKNHEPNKLTSIIHPVCVRHIYSSLSFTFIQFLVFERQRLMASQQFVLMLWLPKCMGKQTIEFKRSLFSQSIKKALFDLEKFFVAGGVGVDSSWWCHNIMFLWLCFAAGVPFVPEHEMTLNVIAKIKAHPVILQMRYI